MQPDAPIQHGEVVVAVARMVERRDAREAAPVDQFARYALELACEPVEREMLLADVEQVVRHRFRLRQRGIELAMVLRRQLDRPEAWIGDVPRRPVDVDFERAWHHGVTRENSPAPRVANSLSFSPCGTETLFTRRVYSAIIRSLPFTVTTNDQLSTQFPSSSSVAKITALADSGAMWYLPGLDSLKAPSSSMNTRTTTSCISMRNRIPVTGVEVSARNPSLSK